MKVYYLQLYGYSFQLIVLIITLSALAHAWVYDADMAGLVLGLGFRIRVSDYVGVLHPPLLQILCPAGPLWSAI